MIYFPLMLLIWFLVATVAYVALSVYFKSLRREHLEKQWDGAPPDGAGVTERTDFIEAGMRSYHDSLRRRLILLVYVVPVIAVSIIIYIVNYR